MDSPIGRPFDNDEEVGLLLSSAKMNGENARTNNQFTTFEENIHCTKYPINNDNE
jgi:hypothetical protein